VPTYDYQCRACGLVTEVIHSMLEPGPSACGACGGELRRVLFPTGIIFKGSGFYRNDSRAAAADAGKAAPSTGSGDPGSSTASASEPKKVAGGGDGASTTASDAKGSSSEA
jgi:putative FmdB family regulatory protein